MFPPIDPARMPEEKVRALDKVELIWITMFVWKATLLSLSVWLLSLYSWYTSARINGIQYNVPIYMQGSQLP